MRASESPPLTTLPTLPGMYKSLSLKSAHVESKKPAALDSICNPLTMSALSLTKTHPAVKLLAKKVRDRSLSGNEKPSVVHKSDIVFSNRNLNNFRACYKNNERFCQL